MAYRSTINGLGGQPFIEAAMTALGPLANAQRLPADVIGRFDKVLPYTLLDVWENYGIGDLAEGRLRLCVPGALQAAVDQLFGNDPYFAGQIRAVAYGAFGDLILWHDTFQIVTVNMQLSSVEMPSFFKPLLAATNDDTMYQRLLQMHPNTMDAYDESATPMFLPAKDAHGDLEDLQIYGMQPPAPFHEAFTLDRHKPVDVTEWLAEKVGASTFTLDDSAGGRFAVRPIGPLRPGEELRRPGEL